MLLFPSGVTQSTREESNKHHGYYECAEGRRRKRGRDRVSESEMGMERERIKGERKEEVFDDKSWGLSMSGDGNNHPAN